MLLGLYFEARRTWYTGPAYVHIAWDRTLRPEEPGMLAQRSTHSLDKQSIAF